MQRSEGIPVRSSLPALTTLGFQGQGQGSWTMTLQCFEEEEGGRMQHAHPRTPHSQI